MSKIYRFPPLAPPEPQPLRIDWFKIACWFGVVVLSIAFWLWVFSALRGVF